MKKFKVITKSREHDFEEGTIVTTGKGKIAFDEGQRLWFNDSSGHGQWLTIDKECILIIEKNVVGGELL